MFLGGREGLNNKEKKYLYLNMGESVRERSGPMNGTLLASLGDAQQ
jgi:hypothetical protein